MVIPVKCNFLMLKCVFAKAGEVMYCVNGKSNLTDIRDVKPFYKLDIKNVTLPSYESP